MLSIVNLHVSVEGRCIINGLNLEVGTGQVHALMGPNGSGKSTLAHVLAGRDGYEVTAGTVMMNDINLLELSAEERAGEGFFLAFQYPVEIPGVNNTYFLRASVNAVRKYCGKEELDSAAFLKFVKQKLQILHLDQSLLKRSVNAGFSGGEKKRNEIFQMAVMEPKVAVLDETDSGLDIDALKDVAASINILRDGQRTMLIITHYHRVLEYIVPDRVHVLSGGKIVKSGDRELALQLEANGYDWVRKQAIEA